MPSEKRLSSEPVDFRDPEVLAAERRAHLAEMDEITRERIRIWLQIGSCNPWISQAVDPPFDELSFHICRDLRELTNRLLQDMSWSLGQAFALDDLCFINQVDGGDEWLTIKGETAFESMTMRTIAETRGQSELRLERFVKAIQQAARVQLLRLEYTEPYTIDESAQVVPDTISLKADREEALALSYEHNGIRLQRALALPVSASPHWILRNGTSRFVLALDSETGEAHLEAFAGVASPERIALPGSVLESACGAGFFDLAPREQLLRLLPFLRRSRRDLTGEQDRLTRILLEHEASPNELCDALDLDIFEATDAVHAAYERSGKPESWIWPMQRLHVRKNEELLGV